jgi:hypothetical protein
LFGRGHRKSHLPCLRVDILNRNSKPTPSSRTLDGNPASAFREQNRIAALEVLEPERFAALSGKNGIASTSRRKWTCSSGLRGEPKTDGMTDRRFPFVWATPRAGVANVPPGPKFHS